MFLTQFETETFQSLKYQDLLSRGANVNIQDDHGYSALFVAARQGHFEIAKLLCQNGADLTSKNYIGRTAINMAEDKGFHHIVSMLKQYM